MSDVPVMCPNHNTLLKQDLPFVTVHLGTLGTLGTHKTNSKAKRESVPNRSRLSRNVSHVSHVSQGVVVNTLA